MYNYYCERLDLKPYNTVKFVLRNYCLLGSVSFVFISYLLNKELTKKI